MVIYVKTYVKLFLMRQYSSVMISTEHIMIGAHSYTYLHVEMGKAPLVLLRGDTGYVMCGYLNMDAAEKLQDIAVRVTGVKDLNTLLSAKAVNLTSGARGLGIKEGDTVSSFVYKL